MSPVRSLHNQYAGINAHLHSEWQATGRWNRFHNVFVTGLMQSLRAALRGMGYTADIEESLQIRRLTDAVRPRGDVVIFDTRSVAPTGITAAAPSLLSVQDLVEEDEDADHPYSAIVISQRLTEGERGEAVAWLELLSPTNKGNQHDAITYRSKRRLLLESGLVFVGLDFLHETPPTFPRLADYSAGEGGHPYRIVVLDPRPNLKEGRGMLYEFDVDEPLPLVTIPLNAGEQLTFDFGAVYQKVFLESFYGDEVDYSQLPMAWERYSSTDQWRVLLRLATVLEAAEQGKDLEHLPLPILQDPRLIEKWSERLMAK
jgi:hypothetical protein